MRKTSWFGLGLTAIVCVNGCTLLQKPPAASPRDAVIQGLEKLHAQPSYRAHSTIHINQLEISGDALGIGADGKNAAAAKQNMPIVNKMMQSFFRHTELSVDNVVDLQHQQFELTPRLENRAANSGGYIQVPMLLDLQKSQAYVDLSALSPFLVNADNDGKYSVFSTKALTDKVDLKKLLLWWRALDVDGYRDIKSQAFHDVALEPADTALGAVRKIELSAPYKDVLDAHLLAARSHKAEFEAALKTRDDSQASAAQADQAGVFVDLMLKGLSRYGDPALFADNPLLQHVLGGSYREVYLLDSGGNYIESRFSLDMDTAPRSPLRMGFDARTRYSDFGSARVAIVPTPENTIAFSDNAKGSFYDLFEKEQKNSNSEAGPSAGEQGNMAASPNPFAGNWESTAANGCKETYVVSDSNWVLSTSAQDIAFSGFLLSRQPSARGFYRLTIRRVADNGLKDCAAQTASQGELTTSFIQFNPRNTMARLCEDESLDHCSLLLRTGDKAH